MTTDLIAIVLVALFGITGSLLMVLSAIAMFRANDALSRINVFSPATGLGMPLILVAAYVYTLWQDGFGLMRLFMALVALLSLIIVSSVASNVLSRSAFVAGAPVWRRTSPNRLAEPRGDEDAGLTERETWGDFDITDLG
jgi:multicomponent Na+:H+ antiporter subunit G